MITPFSAPHPTRITCIDYSAEQCQVQEVSDVPAFLESHRPSWTRVRWINVEGLADIDVVLALADKYQLHPLAVEDLLHTLERPKVEDYPASEGQPGRFFIVARAVEIQVDELVSEQISMFLGRSTLLTFQMLHGDSFGNVRRRLEGTGSQLRLSDVSFLLYCLLDAIVDSYFPILDAVTQQLKRPKRSCSTNRRSGRCSESMRYGATCCCCAVPPGQCANWPAKSIARIIRAWRKRRGPTSATSTTTACKSST